MTRLPVVSGWQCVKALQRAGFEISRQKGSHVKPRRGERTVIVPNHKELDRGTLRGVLEQAGLTADEFIALL
jgi:predicted RNA binding protein YcfA (HicA-like mRNA interferase family)